MVLSELGRRVVRRDGENPTTRDTNSWWPWLSAKSISGPSVNHETAFGLIAVYAAVTRIATTVAGFPIHVYQEEDDEAETPTKIKTPDTSYLWRKPNIEMGKQTFWEMIIGHILVQGDAFIWVEKDEFNDQPIGLWPIDPSRIRVGRTERRQKIYELDRELPMINYAEGGEIVHIPNFGTNPLRGISPLAAAKESIALGLSAQEYASRFFSQSSIPRGVLTGDQIISEQEAINLGNRWRIANSGLANAMRTAVLGSGVKFEKVDFSPEETQLLDVRRFQVQEIARLWGIPPHLLGDSSNSTSWGTGLAEQTRAFVQFTIQHYINRLEQAVDDNLLVRELSGRFVKFDTGGLLRGTTLQRFQAYRLADFMTPNEKRHFEDLPPKEGGDDILAGVNLIPLEQLGEATPAQLAPGGPDTPPADGR